MAGLAWVDRAAYEESLGSVARLNAIAVRATRYPVSRTTRWRHRVDRLCSTETSGQSFPLPILGVHAAGSRTARALYLVLCGHSNREGVCWPSRGRLQRLLGVSRAAYYRAVSELERNGCITRNGIAFFMSDYTPEPSGCFKTETECFKTETRRFKTETETFQK